MLSSRPCNALALAATFAGPVNADAGSQYVLGISPGVILTRSSVSKSTDAVASSAMKTLDLLSRARAIEICEGDRASKSVPVDTLPIIDQHPTSCLSPCEKFSAPVVTGASRLFMRRAASSSLDSVERAMPTRRRTSHKSASVCSERGSRFDRIVPSKSVDSWLMMV